MAEEQKTVVELPKEETPATTIAAPALDTKPLEETPVTATETAPIAATEETKPAEATDAAAETEAPKAEEKKEEAKPVEEGFLSHKAQGLSFPKNLIATKEFFFFGTDAVEPKTLAAYQRTEKSTETAHSNIAWASHTGKGLLFIGDKKAPSSIINLSDATEPEVDGSNKFHLTSKGNKHTFKAANIAERDNWVAQLKLKIAEAKEQTAIVTESEAYKQTIESFKPVVPVKKEVEAPKEEVLKTEEVAKAEEPAKEEEAVKEESKVEEPKRRSASRKRASFFGFGKKDEKKEEVKAEEPVAAATTEAAVPVAEDKPVEAEAPTVEEAAPLAEVAAVPAATTEAAVPVTEDKPAELESPKPESPKEKPSASKRNSFFGSVFSKKEKKPVEAVEPAKEAESALATETAPVIPPVETTTPLAVDVSNPTTVPVETTEVPTATATNGETKKDVKEKRKSSLPFAFGKRDKSPSPVEGEEKSPLSAFSKFRATIKGKSTPKAEEKPAEAEVAKEEAAKETDAKPEETPVAAEAVKEETAKPVETETETKPENVATTTPAVTAAA